MSTPCPSIPIASRAQTRKRARLLQFVAMAFVALGTAGHFDAAHATYPGENGAIVFEGPQGISKVSAGNSAITFLAGGRFPRISPNGKKIAFLGAGTTIGSSELYLMNIDGSDVVKLTNGATSQERVHSPAWLPDGSKITYILEQAPQGPYALFKVNTDGTESTFVRTLSGQSLLTDFLAWSPSSSYTYGFSRDLYIADWVDPTIRLLEADVVWSSWAPDGASVLFTDDVQNQWEINPDGSNLRNVPPGGAGFGSAVISPDGAFIAGPMGTESKLVIRARAGVPTTFTWPFRGTYPSWGRVPKNCEQGTPSGGGGVLAGDVDFYAQQCAIAVMPGSRATNGVLQQAIAVGPDGRLYHRVLESDPSGGTPTWTPFAVVPGVAANPGGVNPKKIAIAADWDGNAQMVIINASDNAVYHAMRYANGTWSGFNMLDGFDSSPNFQARDVAITIASGSYMAHVIANDLVVGGVFHRQRTPNGAWSPFAPLPGTAGMNTHELAMAASDVGINFLATTTAADGSQARIMQMSGGDVGNWVTVGIPTGTTLSASSDVAVTRTLDGKAQMMFTDSTGNAVLQERATPDVSSSWQTEVPGVTITSTAGRAVSISAGSDLTPSSQILVTRTYPQ
jgi:hypothetical protein